MTRRPRPRILVRRGVGSSPVLATVAAMAVSGFAGACSPASDDAAPVQGAVEATTPADNPTAAPSAWSPVHERGSKTVVHRAGRWEDPLDTTVDWIDVRRVRYSNARQHTWTLALTAKPPRAAGLGQGRQIAYGLVLDTDRDNDADYVVGLDNAAPERGDFHVWVSDLATGETSEQVGPPYGFPVEFVHPDEEGTKSVVFTFLGGSAPPGVNDALRFYAWASETRNGEVVAADYVPDKGWLSRR